MNLPWLRDYLGHMLTAAREALSFVDGMSQETFLDERRTQQAVVMSYGLVWETVSAEIPPLITALSNVLRAFDPD